MDSEVVEAIAALEARIEKSIEARVGPIERAMAGLASDLDDVARTLRPQARPPAAPGS